MKNQDDFLTVRIPTKIKDELKRRAIKEDRSVGYVVRTMLKNILVRTCQK
jgi:hypothetical protein